MKLIMVE
jgi:hypothetical protein